MIVTKLWTSPPSKRKSTLFSSYSRILLHRHVKKNISVIKNRIMNDLNAHYITPFYIIKNCSLVWMYKDNMDG